MSSIVFVDIEVVNEKIVKTGAILKECPVDNLIGRELKENGVGQLHLFLNSADYYCGHNYFGFDCNYLESYVEEAQIPQIIDTLYLSPLLFPKKPYHKLLKNDKLNSEEFNNPLSDSYKCMELFMDEISEFIRLDDKLKKIYFTLLRGCKEFKGFFDYMGYNESVEKLDKSIREYFKDKICENAELEYFIEFNPIELSYALSVINVNDKESIIPRWVQYNFPEISEVYSYLRGKPCKQRCNYCSSHFDPLKMLNEKFGYEKFRTYAGEPLQENAVNAAVDNKSLLAIFPTGGGKSITFQLPALMAGEAMHGLTVVISPLQSLMKDQVDNLEKKGIADATTINGMLDPVERTESIERVNDGIANILYLSPESLRSNSIEKMLLERSISRFVIDEAHCFSAWGQDFRVDYLYIGDFIAHLQKMKHVSIPVSCFTATAKQKVISDIREYFHNKLNISLDLFATSAARTNLRYQVFICESPIEKYQKMRDIIVEKNCPTIVYVSRTRQAEEIAQRLTNDGIIAKPYHGKMDRALKASNQNEFIDNEIQVVVATSAFGMGVDKSDVKLVIHYDISDSLENYVQEAGRAGRDSNIEADCYVLFYKGDIDKHFMLLNQSKLSISEIDQIWSGIKRLSGQRKTIQYSALEIAEAAGWKIDLEGIETKVRTAISALEHSGYVVRGNNNPRVFADSIVVQDMTEARNIISNSGKFDKLEEDKAIAILSKMKGKMRRAKAGNDDNESRVDYIASLTSLSKNEVIELVEKMRDVRVLSKDKDMSVYIDKKDILKKDVNKKLAFSLRLEKFLAEYSKRKNIVNFKDTNEEAENQNVKSSVDLIKKILLFWNVKKYIRVISQNKIELIFEWIINPELVDKKIIERENLCRFIDEYIKDEATNINDPDDNKKDLVVKFSVSGLKDAYNDRPRFSNTLDSSLEEVEEAILYMEKNGAYRIDGGFLVIYNALTINRIEMNNRIHYKKEDYKYLEEYYDNKTQQIHIVGEYANMMVRDHDAALQFVDDYFHLDYKIFLNKYFKGRLDEIEKSITPEMSKKLFDGLTAQQKKILDDKESRAIVVQAGPGSGKTKVLVHKLASLLLLEDVKQEQLLMLTFSRAAAIEFKHRLYTLLENPNIYVEIKTFHSYCFDLLGKKGSIEKSGNVVEEAVRMINEEEVETDMITKTVLVIDEAQDMSPEEYKLVKALMDRNENMRVIAVGDDDQNIYEFRGSRSMYMNELLKVENSKQYELTQNFRSLPGVVERSNKLASLIRNRFKNVEMTAVRRGTNEIMAIRAENKETILHTLVNVINKKGKYKNLETKKTVAVLTTKNEEAYLAYDLLEKEGYNPRLIQANEDFSLYNFEEIRFFLTKIRVANEPTISEEKWQEGIEALKNKYRNDSNIESILYTLQSYYEKDHTLYYNDFEEFTQSVRLSDFYESKGGEITISTIHKSKGKEYDDVYMVVTGHNENLSGEGDETLRQLYVGMTRAKDNLYIIQDQRYFHSRNGFTSSVDKEIYNVPNEIVMAMSYKDVWLEALKYQNRDEFGSFQAGEKLDFVIENEKMIFISSNGRKATVSSKRFYEKVKEQQNKGYQPFLATVGFVVYWYKRETDTEYKIVLPVLRMIKSEK